MKSALALLTVAALAALPRAQCLAVGAGAAAGLVATDVYPASDEGRSPPLPLGFVFPLANSIGGPLTHCVVDANGVLFLTGGGAPVLSGTSFFLGSLANLQGVAGASPRIAPYWDDLQAAATGGWSVAVDTSVAGRCAITWSDVAEFPAAAPAKTFQAELFANGVIVFSYGAMAVANGTAWVGISIGNAVGAGLASDLSASPAASGGLVYQSFDAGPCDLDRSTLVFVPSGNDWQVLRTCGPALHSPVGSGCYDLAQFDSFYQLLPNAAAAAAALSGQSMRLTPSGTGYLATWGGGTFVPPSAAAVAFAPSNDAQNPITPSSPMPFPGGSAAVLYVHDNGFVATGPTNDNGNWNPPQFADWDPTTNFLLAPATAWWSWHDFNMTEPGSGAVKYEEVAQGSGPVLCVTWDDVESYAVPETQNRSTVQLQFDLSSGVVTYVWPAITAIGTGSATSFPEATLVGFSVGGASIDPGSIALATALPVLTGTGIPALSLAATPPIVSTSTTGTAVTYTTDHMPEFAPGLYVGMNTLSLAAAPGVDLAFLGAPGCRVYVGTLDVTTPLLGAAPTQAAVIAYPPGMPAGLPVFAQSIALFPPHALPGGSNDFGLLTSNGIASLVGSF